MNSNEFAKLITSKVMNRIQEPRSIRKIRRDEKKLRKKSFLERWFGVIPFGIGVWYDEKKDKFTKYKNKQNITK